MEQWLSDLNDEQRAVVMHGRGPLLVVAGAGTGKTRVITTRIAQLIRSEQARPGQVLALTFTEKAAREMEERLYDLIGWQSYEVAVMTFNAFGAELLGRFASHDGRSVRGGLLKEDQKSLLLKQHLSQLELKYYGRQSDWMEFLDRIVGYIGKLQNAGISVQRYQNFVEGLRKEPHGLHPNEIDEQEDLANLYKLYEEVKEATGTYDFYDQLFLPLQILQQKSNLVERLRAEYKFVLVDEYQDTNSVQDQLLRMIVPTDGNIFAVGDDDQAIYGFRGADISNILSFSQHFNISKTAVLAQNYRSSQPILDAAYRLIKHNDPDRLEIKLGIDKHLVGFRSNGQVRFTEYDSVHDERQAVVAQIVSRIQHGEQASDMAVLSTRHAVLAAVAKDLQASKVPFELSTSVNIFEQPELISLWYLLRWLVWQTDENAIAHVVMGPFIGWNTADYRRVLEGAREHLMTFEEALERDEGQLARELIQKLAQWRSWAAELPVSRVAYRLVFETGVVQDWYQKAEKSPRMQRVFEDLQRWFEQMKDFENIEENTTVLQYCLQYQRPPRVEAVEPVGDAGGVKLLTVHASKGLEFETVYLVGCTKRNWSPARNTSALEMPGGLIEVAEFPLQHEFRRLMYVAATRAKTNLFVSAAVKTQSGISDPVSPHVRELMGSSEQSLVRASDKPLSKLGSVMVKLRKYYPLAQTEDVARPLPFEGPDGWLELSVTALDGYNFCPFDFYLQHVLKISQPIGPALSFGTVLHGLFESYYKDKLAGEVRSAAQYQALLDNSWSDRGYEDRPSADRDKQLAAETLSWFLARENRGDAKILASEARIRLEIPEARLRLTGKMDAIFETGAGIEIRDFKTGRTQTDPAKLADKSKVNFQLRTYALAYERQHDKAPELVTLDYVVTRIEGSAHLSAAILRNHRAKLVELADRLRQRDFAPNLSALHSCAAVRYYGNGEVEADEA